jgi:lipid-A-disaccharide synthase
MAAATEHFLFNLTEHAAMGLWEVLKKIFFFKRIYSAIIGWIAHHRPKRVCFIDSPSLHLRIARRLRKMGISRKGGGSIPIYYYVAPQVWAWKSSRKFSIARDIDALAALFPFEKEVFAETDLPVTFTGHPFTETHYQAPIHYEANDCIFLFPGSRKQCIWQNFPTMLQTFSIMRNDHDYHAVCIYPSQTIGKLLKSMVDNCGKLRPFIRLLSMDEARKQPVGGQLVLVTAGTMSFQCALAGIPGVVMYKTSAITYWMGCLLIKVPFLAMANLLLGYECYREYTQKRANAETLAQSLRSLTNARQEFAAVADELYHCLNQRDLSPIDWLCQEFTPIAAVKDAQ